MYLMLKQRCILTCMAVATFFGGMTAYADNSKKDTEALPMSIPSYHQIFFDNPKTNQPIVSSKALLGDTAALSLNVSIGTAGDTVIERIEMSGLGGYYANATCAPPVAGTLGDITTGTYPFISGQDFYVGQQALYVMAGSPPGTVTRCIRLFVVGNSGDSTAELEFQNLTCTSSGPGPKNGTCTSTDSSACYLGVAQWTSGMPGCPSPPPP